jgi:ABC-2 type transport system ATP-binding protein
MLQARGIVMRYGPRTAVDNVDLDLHPGEILGLLGPNGAGKTTLLRRLAGLLPGSAGTVDLDGGDPAVDAGARARIGYLPEDPPLYADDIALQYVTYLAGLSGVPRSQRKAAATDALRRVGADKLADRVIGRLSKGQRQRVALAGALAHRPDVLLLDEPSEGLDPRQVVALRTLLADLKKKASIVFSTHLLVVIDQGHIVLDRPAGAAATVNRLRVDVTGAPTAEIRAALLALPAVSAVEGPGERGVPEGIVCTVTGPGAAEAIAAEVVGRGWKLRVLAPARDDLEAAFLAAVTGTSL